jgi:hypothetical protein
MRRHTMGSLVTGAALVATVALAGTAAAADTADYSELQGSAATGLADEESFEAGLYAVHGDEYAPVPSELISNDETPIGESEVSPYLITFPQWVSCYTLNNSGDVFASYQWAWDGVAHTKDLKCGTLGWGYRHIEDRHKTDWQNKLDQMQDAGLALNYTWDDVMASGIWAGLDWADFYRPTPAQNKACVVGELAFIDSNGEILQHFSVATAFATDSTRIITSYPTSTGRC